MKIDKVKGGVQVTCFGATADELLRDLHDTVSVIEGLSEPLFAVKKVVKRKRRMPAKKDVKNVPMKKSAANIIEPR